MSYITDEQIGQIAEQVGLVGPASRVDDCHAASLRFARVLLTLAAPAVPSHAEIEANIWPQLRLNGHPTLTLNDCIASIHAALTAAPTPPAQTPESSEVPRES